jgi:hypothetical protein
LVVDDALEWEPRRTGTPTAARSLTKHPSRIWSTHDKTLTKAAPPDASDASTKADKLDGLDAAGPINGGRIGLRALWGVFPVVVRVHLSACGRWAIPSSVASRTGAGRNASGAGEQMEEGARREHGNLSLKGENMFVA